MSRIHVSIPVAAILMTMAATATARASSMTPSGLASLTPASPPDVRVSADTTPRPVGVEDLFSIQRVGSPRVSPDGAWIAYTVSTTSLEKEESFTRIWMVSSAGGDPVAMTVEGKSASSPEWSPDGRYLTFLGSREEGKSQVWALDRRGGEAVALTEVEQGVSGYRWSPDATRLLLTIRDAEEKDPDAKEGAPRDPWVIDRLQFKRDYQGYLTGDRHTHLYVMDLETRTVRQLTTGRWDEGSPEWSPDGSRVAFVSNRTDDPDANRNSDIWVVDAGLTEPTDSPRRVTTQPGSDGSPAWSPDGRSIAYVTTTDVDAIWYATGHLAVISAEGGEPRVLTASLDRNPSSPRWSDDGAWIWFGLEDSAEDHLVRIRPDGSGLTRVVAGPLSAGDFDWAGGTMAMQVGTLDRPTEIHVVETDGDGSPHLRRVTHHNDEWLSGIALGRTRNVQFASADGTEIEGFVTFPPDFVSGRRYPVILRIHGGPVSQYSHTFNFEAQMFAADGYVVVYTNPRGSSGYGQAFSQAIFADWGNLDFQDVMAGVDHVIEEGWGDPDRLGVGGWSYGGILTNYVITQTGRFKGAVSGASEVLYVANYGHDHYQYEWEKELGVPWEGDNRERWERISPFNRVQDVTTPTLVMGGEDDWNVPILNSEQLYQALRRRGVPTQLVVYPGQSHGIAVPSYQKDRYERYLEWYARWVRDAAPTAPPVSH
ncbi:MAG: S9 family peptidase [Gemmatimonadota bacterium]|nr:S9 family peptidase [Gemmatimonadota bacterium]